jgi:hypothetical protein
LKEYRPLTQADVTDVVMYIDGTPYPVTIDEFNVYEEATNYSVIFYDYEPFTAYPAYYQVSFKVQGVEFTKEELWSIMAYADGTAEFVEPTVTPGQPSDNSGAESPSRGWSSVNPAWDTESGLFDGTGSASIWHESLSLTQADITDVVVYIDGTPHPISITQFNESNEYGEGKFYGIFFDEFFTVWPATYTLSYKVQGVEVSPAECLSVVVYADGTHEYVAPSN